MVGCMRFLKTKRRQHSTSSALIDDSIAHPSLATSTCVLIFDTRTTALEVIAKCALVAGIIDFNDL